MPPPTTATLRGLDLENSVIGELVVAAVVGAVLIVWDVVGVVVLVVVVVVVEVIHVEGVGDQCTQFA